MKFELLADPYLSCWDKDVRNHTWTQTFKHPFSIDNEEILDLFVRCTLCNLVMPISLVLAQKFLKSFA